MRLGRNGGGPGLLLRRHLRLARAVGASPRGDARTAPDCGLAALAAGALARTRAATSQLCGERERLRAALSGVAGVRRVYPSQGNFLLLRFADAQTAFDALLAAGVVVRDMRATARLGDALRISIGTPEQNERVIATLARQRRAA